MPIQAIDAWTQVAFRNGREVLPEVIRAAEEKFLRANAQRVFKLS